MSHSLTKIWIHGLFGTKNREALIKSTFENELHIHLKNKLENELECTVRTINGNKNHIHILFLLNPNYSIREVFKTIKGESSHWINQNDFLHTKFSWQIGYGAFSVSESQLKKVELYIKNQKEHHKQMTFEEEYEKFILKYKVKEGNR
ncbi:MAG: IS200/IS605 family transposase [Ignavibacteriae bacterium]|nr:IS200/IS605 family transposase [Ignavibacteriota bacterium]